MHNDINVVVSGPVQPSSTYKTVVLKGNQSFASQVTEPDMKYIIRWDFDLNDEVVTVPENCILEFDGGSLDNGVIVGQDTVFINVGDVDIWGKNLTREGTWRDHSGGGLPNKPYNPETHSGLGRKTLQLKDSSNILIQEDFDQSNTIYIVEYDFDLDGETIEMPEGCVLEFDGGTITNGVLQGYVLNDYLRPEWFGAKRDGVTDDTWAIQTCVDIMNIYGGTVLLNRGCYLVTHIDLKTKTNLKGSGIGASIIQSNTTYEKGIVNVIANSIQCIISDLSIIGSKPYKTSGGHPNGSSTPVDYDDNNWTQLWQDGIYTESVSTIDGANYGMSFYLQENTGIENNKQTYRNLTIENVYIGRCRYGMNLNNRAYRTVVQKCDVKRCVIGIRWGVTDSDIHNIYIERCDRSGFKCSSSNNNVTDIKSIWNGRRAPYDSFGLELRGNRNRYVNLEAQDNYCSGIASSGNENIYSNILANGDGYAYDAALDEENDGLCEWYVNTLTSSYKNCLVCNYSTRQSEETVYEKPFPKYPIKYGADGVGTGQEVKIVGSTSGTFIAREPINIPDLLPCSDIFDIVSASVTANPEAGYLVDANGYKSKDIQRHIQTSGQFTVVFEFTLDAIEHTGNISCKIANSYNDIYIYVSPSKNIELRCLYTSFNTSISDADLSKPIRIAATITPRKKDGNKWIYDAEIDAWYYSNEYGCYRYEFKRKPNIEATRTNTFIGVSSVSFNELWTTGQPLNSFYLRTFMVSESHDIPCSIAYPNARISHLNPVIGFDFRGLNGSSRPDVGTQARRPLSLISKGYQYFNTDINKPQWYDGEDWVTALLQGQDMEASTFTEITSSVTSFETLPPGRYRWDVASDIANVADWPEQLQKGAGILMVFPLTTTENGRVIQIIFSSSLGFFAFRNSRASDHSGLTWYIHQNVKAIATSSRPTATFEGLQVFDTTLGKPIWWDGTNWVDATGNNV